MSPTLNKRWILLSLVGATLVAAGMAASCGVKQEASTASDPSTCSANLPTNTSPWGTVPTGSNVMSLTVDSTCDPGQDPNNPYWDEPCVSVTVCTPGTATCQTIPHILVDTGSVGLRIFSNLLTGVTPTPVNVGTQIIDCVYYLDGTSQWGPVGLLDVMLGGQKASSVPVHMINPSFPVADAAQGLCSSKQSTQETSPAQAGYNGILGVGLDQYDCGTDCAKSGNDTYYTCNGTTCTSPAVPVTSQVTNPVTLLPKDNNGVIVELPWVPAGGASSANGYLVFGIGTESNNSPGSATYLAAQSDLMETEFDAYQTGQIPSFIDSGSNAMLFPVTPSGSLPFCSDGQSFCPANTLSFSALNTGGSGSSCTEFQVTSLDSLFETGNWAFSDIGVNSGTGANAMFDWGLPFFFGRKVYVGISGTTSPLGTGPYWAY